MIALIEDFHDQIVRQDLLNKDNINQKSVPKQLLNLKLTPI